MAEFTPRQIEELAKCIALAREMDQFDEGGGLHIIIADGNVYHDDIVWAQSEQNTKGLTPEERAFAQRLQMDYFEGEIAFAWFLRDQDLHHG